MNNFAINEKAINTAKTPLQLTQDSIIFDGYSFLSACTDGKGVIVEKENYRDLAIVDLQTVDKPTANGGIVLKKRRTKKVIDFTIALLEENSSKLEDLIDEFKRNTRKTNGLLEIKFNEQIRVINATCVDISPVRVNKLEYSSVGIKVSFVSVDPNFRLKVDPNVSFLNINKNFQEEITNLGNTESFAQLYLIFKNLGQSLDGGSAIQSIDNSVNGGGASPYVPISSYNGGGAILTTTPTNINGITITLNGFIFSIQENITTGDVVIFDMEKKTATLNGTEIIRDGVMTELEVGANPISFEFTGGNFNVDISAIWKEIYL